MSTSGSASRIGSTGSAARPRRTTAGPVEASAHAPALLLAAFCVYLLAWFLQLSYRLPSIQSFRVELVLGTALAIVAALFLIARPISLGVGGRGVAVSAILLVAVITSQVPFSAGGVAAWPIYEERVLKFGFMAIFIAAFVRSARDMKWFLATLLVAAGYICLESLEGALTGTMIWENQGVPRLHGSTPLFAHPNSLGGLAAGVLPFTVFLYSAFHRRVGRILLIALSILALIVIMYTGSRTAYVGTIALGGLWLLRSQMSPGAKLGAVTAAVLLVLVAVPAEYKARFGTIATGTEIEGASMQTRREIIRDAVAIFKEHPFGVGVEGFSAVRIKTFGRFQDTHNLYLQVATHLGIQGLLIFGIFIFVLWRHFGRYRSIKAPATATASERHAAEWIRAVATAAQAYLFLRLVLGFFGHDLYEIYWWILTGIGLALAGLTAGMPQLSLADARGRSEANRHHRNRRSVNHDS